MSISRPVLTPIAAALLILSISAAHAQTAPAEPATTTLGTVTVNASADASAEGLTKPFAGGQVARGGRVGILGTQDIMDTPFSSTSYTNELIQDQQAKSVGDVLLNDPAVRLSRGFGNYQEAYIIRGFPVYSDDVAYNGLYGMLPRQYIATEFMERVEVFKGSNSFLNGAAPGGSGLGGAVNLLPKRAPNEPVNRIGFGLQTGGQYLLSTDIARRFGPDQATGVRLNAIRRDGGTGIDQEKRQTNAVSLGLDWRSRNVRLSGDFNYQDDNITGGRPSVTPAAGTIIPTPPNASSNFSQPWSYSKERDLIGTVRGEVDFSDNVTGWLAGGIRNTYEDNILANTTLTSNTTGATSSARFSNTRKDYVTTAEIGLRGKFKTGSVGHAVVASATTFSDERRNAYAFSAVNVLNNIYAPFVSAYPVANSAAAGFTGNNLSDPALQARVETSSLALADTLSFMQESVLLTLGARSQRIKSQTYAYNTGLQTAEYNKTKTTPVLGLVVKPTRELSLYANYIEGLVQGGTAGNTFNSLPVANAGAILPPFTSKQKEIGAKYDGGKFGASASLFSIAQPNAIYINQTYTANGEQRNQGLEISLFGEPLKGVKLLGGVTFLNAKLTKTQGGLTDGQTPVGIPRQQLNIGTEIDVSSLPGLALNARLLTTGQQYADVPNTRTVSGWNRLDVGARYIFNIGNGRAMTVRARVDNLLNKSYWASTGGASSNYLVLGAPRTLTVSSSIDF